MRALLTITLFLSILFAAVDSQAQQLYCVVPANEDGSRPIDEDDMVVFTVQEGGDLPISTVNGAIGTYTDGFFNYFSKTFTNDRSLTPIRAVIIKRGEERGANRTVIYVLDPDLLFPGDRTTSIAPFIENGDASNGRSVQFGVVYYKYEFSLDEPPAGP
jgi:hypothetical protein